MSGEVTSYELRVAGYRLQVAGCGLLMAVKDGKAEKNSRKVFGRAYLCGMNLAFKRSGVIKFF